MPISSLQIFSPVYNGTHQKQRRFPFGEGAFFLFHKLQVKEEILMKKLEIIIQPEKLEDLKSILDESNASGLMISNVMGYGNQKGHKKVYRGAEYSVNLLPKVKVETVIEPDAAEVLIEKIVSEIRTGKYGDGKIFVYEVEDAVRIRTGERGTEAL